jgi:hypothetical protein
MGTDSESGRKVVMGEFDPLLSQPQAGAAFTSLLLSWHGAAAPRSPDPCPTMAKIPWRERKVNLPDAGARARGCAGIRNRPPRIGGTSQLGPVKCHSPGGPRARAQRKGRSDLPSSHQGPPAATGRARRGRAGASGTLRVWLIPAVQRVFGPDTGAL